MVGSAGCGAGRCEAVRIGPLLVVEAASTTRHCTFHRRVSQWAEQQGFMAYECREKTKSGISHQTVADRPFFSTKTNMMQVILSIQKRHASIRQKDTLHASQGHLTVQRLLSTS